MTDTVDITLHDFPVGRLAALQTFLTPVVPPPPPPPPPPDDNLPPDPIPEPTPSGIPAPPVLAVPAGKVIFHSNGWKADLLEKFTVVCSPINAAPPALERSDYGDITPIPVGSVNILRYHAWDIHQSHSFDNSVKGQVGLRLNYGANGSWSALRDLYGHVVAFPTLFYFDELPELENGDGMFMEWGWQHKAPGPNAAVDIEKVPGGIAFWLMTQTPKINITRRDGYPMIQAKKWYQMNQTTYFHKDPAVGWTQLEFMGQVLKHSTATMIDEQGYTGTMLTGYLNNADHFTGYFGDTAIVDLGKP